MASAETQMARPSSAPPANADDYDDEEALLWEALRRLPTLEERARHAIVTLEDGSRKVADVGRVGPASAARCSAASCAPASTRTTSGSCSRSGTASTVLLLYEAAAVLALLIFRTQVGIVLPTVEVRFEHLNADVEVCVGNRGLPTVLNSITNIFEGAANALHILPSRKRKLPILHGISGIIKPRRMTLLLGPPGSGKTTFLLALAGRLGSDLQVSGKVTYNGHEMGDFVPERTAAYVSQHDLHIGEMTVRETLVFSARCQRYLHDLLLELLRREEASNIKPDVDIDVFMKAAALGGREANIVTEYILKVHVACIA
ncbi:ABC transporter G family member 35-like [Lolium rigidum]|uniref:ABC transporter G family member 35-like n=1 Tax=Lolium rigidum TaxID=89674 RepID=UPI001F5C134D|nr:ABC transporter G family member 35-like [Lolium rigidum]